MRKLKPASGRLQKKRSCHTITGGYRQSHSWQATTCLIVVVIALCLTAMFMKDGKLTMSVKLKDWLELYTEVNKQHPFSEPNK